ncbi:MAG TPA: carbohydrate ABC transporter permease [Rectinemataceae bacterium]|nr:carbohydrate ABC transporter permease [Rectinemataceae bacterium]
MKNSSAAARKKGNGPRRVLLHIVLILVVLVWSVPTFGVLVTSFRDSRDIFSSGWWTIFPHKAWVKTGEMAIDDKISLDDQIILEGKGATFAQWREGIQTSKNHMLKWYGNKRTRLVETFERKWVGFSVNLTLKNYKNVLSAGEITFKDAEGKEISRMGQNFVDAVLNSLAVTIPSTCIPILIAAFAAYAFAWMEFPGRKSLFIIVVALLVVPLQIALIPVLRDFTRLDLNGSFLGMWLAHTGFGLPLAVYLLFNYISQLPRDIFESAFIDGATPFEVFVKLVLPLSVPALASFAIFQFLWVWNDYLVALIFLGDKNRVVTSALAAMVGEKGQDWHLLTSGAFLSMILPLIVFFSLQRYFVRGLMAGSVKG